jgi:hypothetical protein
LAKLFYFLAKPLPLRKKNIFFLAKYLSFDKTFLLIGKIITFQQKIYPFLVKPLFLGKTNIFTWLKFHLSTKPLYFIAKLLSLSKTNMFY